MNSEDFSALFDSFRHRVVRFEALPAYSVGGAEAERIQAFRDGRPRPERSVRTSPWLARIATSTLEGKSWSRVRVVDNPLSEYQRFQLSSYVESQAVGEQITITPRGAMPDHGPDFWLFDDGFPGACAVLMHYHDDGRLDRRELVVDPGMIAAMAGVLRIAENHAVSLNEFLISRAARP